MYEPTVIKTSQDLIDESVMGIPNPSGYILNITSPIEQHFVNVLDKHHSHQMFDEDYNDAFGSELGPF